MLSARMPSQKSAQPARCTSDLAWVKPARACWRSSVRGFRSNSSRAYRICAPRYPASTGRVGASALTASSAASPPLRRHQKPSTRISARSAAASGGRTARAWSHWPARCRVRATAVAPSIVTIGRCHAAGCARFHVDDSRNRTRRFCSNACASRTTVAAHRARRKAAG
ncbi:CGNR zinc finger domain-containing protein [Kitasatospora sp. LaBMicrA B282]|uniref:CGNR zinc finger domain-containing protein n=1 Tax=Kitasatospora sp. LaBMicrA B282 TaxID=3420949 RepID=UPI003D0AB1DA